MTQEFYVVPEALHNALVSSAFLSRGYAPDEVSDTVRLCAEAARHGIRTHNAVKALDLEEKFGRKMGGCVPGAEIQKLQCRFPVAQVWTRQLRWGITEQFEHPDYLRARAERNHLGPLLIAWPTAGFSMIESPEIETLVNVLFE